VGKVLEGATWFRGWYPGYLRKMLLKLVWKLLKVAHKWINHFMYDLNYRSNYGNMVKTPSEVMPELLQYTNVVLGDIDTTYFMLGQSQK
jgi:2-dehydro-3-deoxygluconokinase